MDDNGLFIKDRQNEQQDFMEMFDDSISEDTLDMPELMNNNNQPLNNQDYEQ